MPAFVRAMLVATIIVASLAPSAHAALDQRYVQVSEGSSWWIGPTYQLSMASSGFTLEH